MIHNLTEKQLQALRWIMKQVEDNVLQESFIVISSSTVDSPDAILIPGISDLPDYINAGALEALTISGVLRRSRAPGGAVRYTLTKKANSVAAFDFGNPEPGPITLYIKKTYPLIKARFDLPEFKGLCFDLDVDPDRYIEDKKNRELELCRYLWRVGRLQELTPALQKLRPNFDDWPPYPGQEGADG
jgi:hypothetical protein